MKKDKLFYTAVLVASLIAACDSADPKPSRATAESTGQTTPQAGELPISNSDIILDGVTLSVTPDPMLLTPQVRQEAMNATAVSYANTSKEALIARGFPEKAIDSQHRILPSFFTHFLFNGVGYDNRSEFSLDATAVNLDGTELDGYIGLISVGHGFHPDVIQLEIQKSIVKQLGMGNIEFKFTHLEKMDIDGVLVDGINIGVAADYSSTKDKTVDRAFLVINKETLTKEVQEKLLNGAVKMDGISFDWGSKDENYYGVCEPVDTSFASLPMEGGKYIGKILNTMLVSPWLTGGGCSGNGVFVVTPEGEVKLKGINFANFHDDPGYQTTVQVYPFADMGEEVMWQKFREAVKNEQIK